MKIKITKNNLNVKKEGFTLLLTMLVLSIVLMVSLSVFGITIKQLKLSGLGRDSQIAFYAADSGVECAAYWDFKSLGEIYEPLPDPPPPTIYDLICAGVTGMTMEEKPSGSSIYVSSFERILGDDSCVSVTVTKDKSSSVTVTTIRSDGYNLHCDSVNDRKVERTLQVSYCDGICP